MDMKLSFKLAFVEEEYFNLDSIMATNANITCNFDTNTPKDFFPLMGQKAPDSLSDRGLRTGILAWMVPAVDFNCFLAIPAAYNAISRDVINAGAQVANFERIQRHFYKLGTFVCRLIGGDEGRSIATALLVAFTQRIGWILRRAVDPAAKAKFMDELEKCIFKVGQKTESKMQDWIRCVDKQTLKRKRTHSGTVIF